MPELNRASRHSQLKILDAYGEQFLGLFDPGVVPNERKQSPGITSRMRVSKRRKAGKASPLPEFDEWSGFQVSDNHLECGCGADGESAGNGDHQPVVVFSGSPAFATSSSTPNKAFMSSKVTKVTKNVTEEPGDSKSEAQGEGHLNLTNRQNDALLHRLVHTKLFPEFFELDVTNKPTRRQNTIAGRVLEASGEAKMGNGEEKIKSSERNRASKRVREGLLAKEEKKKAKTLEEAKNAGNYHPIMKQLYGTTPTKFAKARRERGLKMGVGSFQGGTLRLGRSDLSKIGATGSRGGRPKG